MRCFTGICKEFQEKIPIVTSTRKTGLIANWFKNRNWIFNWIPRVFFSHLVLNNFFSSTVWPTFRQSLLAFPTDILSKKFFCASCYFMLMIWQMNYLILNIENIKFWVFISFNADFVCGSNYFYGILMNLLFVTLERVFWGTIFKNFVSVLVRRIKNSLESSVHWKFSVSDVH